MTKPAQPLPDDLLGESEARYPHLSMLARHATTPYMTSVFGQARAEMQAEAQAVLGRLAEAEGREKKLYAELQGQLGTTFSALLTPKPQEQTPHVPAASCTGKEVVDDPVNHPFHYTHSEIECWDVIEDWNLPYHLGNVLKYICRAGHKSDAKEDLLKAKAYLDRYLAFRFGVTPAKKGQAADEKSGPERLCGQCGVEFSLWTTDIHLRNRCSGTFSRLCPTCFCQLAEKAGVRPTSWTLSMPGAELAQVLDDLGCGPYERQANPEGSKS